MNTVLRKVNKSERSSSAKGPTTGVAT